MIKNRCPLGRKSWGSEHSLFLNSVVYGPNPNIKTSVCELKKKRLWILNPFAFSSRQLFGLFPTEHLWGNNSATFAILSKWWVYPYWHVVQRDCLTANTLGRVFTYLLTSLIFILPPLVSPNSKFCIICCCFLLVALLPGLQDTAKEFQNYLFHKLSFLAPVPTSIIEKSHLINSSCTCVGKW